MWKALAISAVVAGAAAPEDIGFEDLFTDSLEEVYPEQCQSPSGLPTFLDGNFVLQTTAQYSMGDRHFGSWLDAYWKIHTVKFSAGTMCYKTKVIRTGYYNNSLAKDTVAPGVLFLETEPPRDCFLGGLCNMFHSFGAANDNNFAISYRIPDSKGGYRYALMTDTEVHLDFDINTLDVIGSRDFQDSYVKPLHMLQGGGTHLQCEAGKGTSADDCQGDLFGVTFEQGPTNIVDLYRLKAGSPDVRELISHVHVPYVPGSLHSFGITDDYAIIPLSPFTVNAVTMLEGGDLMHAMDIKDDKTVIKLVNLKNGRVKSYTLSSPLWYVHIVNSWQNGNEVLFDVSAFEDQPFTLDNPAMVLPVLRNKTARDAADNFQTIKRVTINLDTGSVVIKQLTTGTGMIDFPKVSPSKYGRPYCIYYAVEWKHNGVEYGSWALRKHNVCTDEVIFHYEPNNYFSEGIFVPNGGSAEDDGVVMTMHTNGVTNTSTMLILDARTMEPLSEAELPHKLGWFGHGAYFPTAQKDLQV